MSKKNLALALVTGQGYIREVSLIPEIPEGVGHVLLEVMPLQRQLGRGSHGAGEPFHVTVVLTQALGAVLYGHSCERDGSLRNGKGPEFESIPRYL